MLDLLNCSPIAQAEQMKGMVNDLVLLVKGGNENPSVNPMAKLKAVRQSKKNQTLLRIHRPAVMQGNRKRNPAPSQSSRWMVMTSRISNA